MFTHWRAVLLLIGLVLIMLPATFDVQHRFGYGVAMLGFGIFVMLAWIALLGGMQGMQ
jgi:hypothetical protein